MALRRTKQEFIRSFLGRYNSQNYYESQLLRIRELEQFFQKYPTLEIFLEESAKQEKGKAFEAIDRMMYPELAQRLEKARAWVGYYESGYRWRYNEKYDRMERFDSVTGQVIEKLEQKKGT